MTDLSSSNLRIGGLVSGLDTDQIIKDLVKAQRLKLSGYQQNKTILEWKQQDYRSINNLLRRLRDVTSDLRLQGTYLRKVAVSSQESVVTATGGTTGEGVYSIVVTRLATSATKVGRSLSADPTAKIDTSASLWSQRDIFADGTDADTDTSVNFEWGSEGDTFSFSINGEEFTFANTVTLDRIFAEVSANENAKVTMIWILFTDRVVITTKSTGDNRPGDEIVIDDPSGFQWALAVLWSGRDWWRKRTVLNKRAGHRTDHQHLCVQRRNIYLTVSPTRSNRRVTVSTDTDGSTT